MRRLQGQRKCGTKPIIGCLSHLGRSFYTFGGPPAALTHAATTIPVPRQAAGHVPASLPLTIIFKCPAATLLDTSRIASDILPPQSRHQHCTAAAVYSHSFAPQTRNPLLRSFRSRPRLLLFPFDFPASPSPHRTLSTMAQPEWTGVRVRNTFFEFFEKKGHTIVPSSSVVPHNDPTLRE